MSKIEYPKECRRMVVRNLESIRLFLKSMCIIPEYQKQRESSGQPEPLGIGVTMWDEVQMNIESSRNHSYIIFYSALINSGSR